jgi:hypothetical protein
MLEHTALSPEQAAQEIDRYIARPGQAPAYLLGYQEIVALRSEAEQAVGERFDLRAFHQIVLGSGSTTLPLLRERVQRWIRGSARPAGLGPRIDVRGEAGAKDACTESAQARAYRGELEASVASHWVAEPSWGFTEPLVLPVVFAASGARALLPPQHAQANLAEAATACLTAMAATAPPECLRERRGEIVFLIPWSTLQMRQLPQVQPQQIPIAGAFESEALGVPEAEDLPAGGEPKNGADER